MRYTESYGETNMGGKVVAVRQYSQGPLPRASHPRNTNSAAVPPRYQTTCTHQHRFRHKLPAPHYQLHYVPACSVLISLPCTSACRISLSVARDPLVPLSCPRSRLCPQTQPANTIVNRSPTQMLPPRYHTWRYDWPTPTSVRHRNDHKQSQPVAVH